MNLKIKQDYEILTGEKWKWNMVLLRFIRHRRFRFAVWGRVAAAGRCGALAELFRRHYEKRYGLEIKFNHIGGGLLLFHPYNITVAAGAVLGEQVTLYKGCVIGSIRSGKRKGTPIIGNRVVICSNANVLGGITIGNDVLIAGGAMVNFNVPDHSVVIGNPGEIHYKENCVDEYLTGK